MFRIEQNSLTVTELLTADVMTYSVFILYMINA